MIIKISVKHSLYTRVSGPTCCRDPKAVGAVSPCSLDANLMHPGVLWDCSYPLWCIWADWGSASELFNSPYWPLRWAAETVFVSQWNKNAFVFLTSVRWERFIIIVTVIVAFLVETSFILCGSANIAFYLQFIVVPFLLLHIYSVLLSIESFVILKLYTCIINYKHSMLEIGILCLSWQIRGLYGRIVPLLSSYCWEKLVCWLHESLLPVL